MGFSVPLLNLSSSTSTSTTTSSMATATVLPHSNPNPYSYSSSSLLRFPPQSHPFARITSSKRRGFPIPVAASLSAVESRATSGTYDEKKLLLEVKDLTAVVPESKQEILKGVNLTVYEGEVTYSVFSPQILHF